MTNTDRPRFARAMAVLAQTLNEAVNDLRIEGYFVALSDLDVEQIESAVTKAVRNCRFFPKPIELREFAVGSLDEQALDYWNSWRAAARSFGSMRSVICPEPVAIAIEHTFGSWPEACTLELSPEMWASKRKEFTANYRRAALDENWNKLITRLLRGTEPISGKWNALIAIEDGGGLANITLDQANKMLHGGPDEHKLTKLLSA